MQTKTTLKSARCWLVLVTVLVLVTAATSGWAANSAPDFTLKSVQDGKEYSLSQFKGKVVLINFFTFFCPPCREEMPYLNQMDQELQGQGFRTLGIGLGSTPEQLKQLVTQLGLAYPVLQGDDAVSKAYGDVEWCPHFHH